MVPGLFSGENDPDPEAAFPGGKFHRGGRVIGRNRNVVDPVVGAVGAEVDRAVFVQRIGDRRAQIGTAGELAGAFAREGSGQKAPARPDIPIRAGGEVEIDRIQGQTAAQGPLTAADASPPLQPERDLVEVDIEMGSADGEQGGPDKFRSAKRSLQLAGMGRPRP